MAEVGVADDPRRLRARAALRRAACELAAAHPLNEVTLAEVAARAGVSRSTAYVHAASARELVEAVLVDELDAIRARHLPAVAPDAVAEAVRAATRDVALHVRLHAGIYRRALAWEAGAAGLHGMLAAQFGLTVRMLLDAHRLDPGAVGAGSGEIVVRGIADGAAGQLAAWIRGPEPYDVDAFLAANAALLPAWWPRTA